MVGSATIGQVSDVVLSAGDTTVPVAVGASAVVIVLPVSNGSVLKLRTNLNSGDTGLPVGPQGYVVFPLASGVTSLIVNAPGSGSFEASFV
jgi:hypothetical protein